MLLGIAGCVCEVLNGGDVLYHNLEFQRILSLYNHAFLDWIGGIYVVVCREAGVTVGGNLKYDTFLLTQLDKGMYI